ncbi:hypothetical protein A2819_00185 [Candidatus Azambacteria bacterium RIFCSPHIGHO2_01_FULL_40_24]|uniref:Transcription regulator TrmB N-terminal domain-containing protein n=1 Tax=Candidatus Azambacteria bacterium RIFCSPHIGHO2_01_FULL_40_24 TaxID=1797301 RepID=A0A1F5B3G9_9BACT|nr:hypothetical protein [Candidatus Woesearchaeota archaeon]OGD25170.1 MAG: hypothetical protein A2819_00185 [Candidatus Azambacteria bacterium RIFCSPHIGHO2_01_FULL_40_24]
MQEILEQAGLSKVEVQVYLTLSKLGLSSAYRIAAEAHLFRANVYEALSRLTEKTLVREKRIGGKLLFEASDPRVIMDILDEKRRNVESLIPQILLQQRSVMKETVFQEYKGPDAVVNALFHFLDYGKPILVWGVPKTAYALLAPKIDLFHEERIKRKVVMKHIYNSTAYERVSVLKKMPCTKIRILPALYDSEVATNVCGDEVMFVLYKAPVSVMLIKNKDMAEAYKRYFEILWTNAKKA